MDMIAVVGGGEDDGEEGGVVAVSSSSLRFVSCPINFWGSARQASERRQAFLLDDVAAEVYDSCAFPHELLD
jgi:hypothetical protein